MTYLPLKSLFLCALLGCTPAKITLQQQQPTSPPLPLPLPPKTPCPDDLFMEATGTGKTPTLASGNAREQIVSSIVSNVESQTRTVVSSNESEGKLEDSSSFSISSQIKSSLTLLGFKEIESKPIEDSLHKYRGYVCNSDLAMPFLDSLRNYKEELEVLKRHKLDKDACDKAIETRKNMRNFETILKFLKQPDKALQRKYEDVYERIKEDCGLEASKKLHWNPEKQTEYSNIAFSKLSAGIKMETSPCKGKGISLIYKGVPDCKSNGGPYGCLYQPSLLLASCDGAKIRLLESPAPVKAFDQKQEVAEKKLQDSLKSKDFWNIWEQEIKRRSSE